MLHKIPWRSTKKLVNSKSNKDVLALWNTLTPLTKTVDLLGLLLAKGAMNKTSDTALAMICEVVNDVCWWPGCPHRRPRQKVVWSSLVQLKNLGK